MFRAAAARLKLPASATATKYFRLVNSMPTLCAGSIAAKDMFARTRSSYAKQYAQHSPLKRTDMTHTEHPPASRLGTRMQLGHVVSDLDAALTYWTEALGVGPFVVLDSSVGDRQFFHRGEPSAVNFSIAISYIGDTMVELITPLNAAPSPYSEFLAQGREGLHHIGYWP